MMHRFIIDTDGGADDAIAIMMALRHPDVQVEAITTVAGNVSVEQATRNALYLVELCGARVPVYQGSGRPMLREPSNAQSIHGKDGLGDLGLDPPQNKPQSEHAVDALIHCITDAPGEITVVALGPLTNVALALLKEPDLAVALRDVCMMGGAVNTLAESEPTERYNWFSYAAIECVARLYRDLGTTIYNLDQVQGAWVQLKFGAPKPLVLKPCTRVATKTKAGRLGPA